MSTRISAASVALSAAAFAASAASVALVVAVPAEVDALDAEPEVPDEYHLDLLEWATWRALRNHDADIDGDPANISIVMARSSSHKKRFDEAVAECKRKNKYMNTQHVEFGVRANWS